MTQTIHTPVSAASTRELGALPLHITQETAVTDPSTQTLVQAATEKATEALSELAHPCEDIEDIETTARVAAEAYVPEMAQDIRRSALLEVISELHDRVRLARQNGHGNAAVQYENTIELISELGK